MVYRFGRVSAVGRTRRLTGNGMNRSEVLQMIRRRARDAGLSPPSAVTASELRGFTAYFLNGGIVEHAQTTAAHESARITKLYDRRGEQVSLDETEILSV
jgi:hypothetical protein